MEAFLANLPAIVQQYATNANEAVRARIVKVLRDVQHMLESPEDTMKRLIYSTLEMSSLRVSLDLDIFAKLVESSVPLTAKQLAEVSNADPALLVRFLRHQAALGFIQETAPDTFAANHITHNLSVPEVHAGLSFTHDVSGPAFHVLPDFLLERKHRDAGTDGQSAWQKAFNTELPVFEWIHQRPEKAAQFNKMMYLQRSNIQSCFDILPLDMLCKDWSSSQAVFVDIGGGTGQQCMALRKKFPALPGRVILEDLPPVVAEADLPSDIEKIPYDFYTAQPVIGARFYYMRSILHDHSDEECLTILSNIAEAMRHESVLLLDEVVIPSQGVDRFVAGMDLSMMTHFASMERTEAQVRKLLDIAGLDIQNIQIYAQSEQLSIITAKHGQDRALTTEE